MKRERITKTLILCSVLVGGIVFLASCGKDTKQTMTTKATDTLTTTAATTTVTTASVPAISGTLATNVIGVTPTWTETAIDPAKTMYVKVVSDYLRIRKGPGTEYGQVGSLTNGMTVSVVAKTDTNWYKLQDGYYVSGDFLTETPIALPT